MWEQLIAAFGLRSVITPGLLAVTLSLGILYFVILGSLRDYIPGSAPVPLSQKIAFTAGLIAFYVGFGGPLYLIGHVMFSVHMLQMAIAFLVAPLLMLLGTPGWLLKLGFDTPVLNILFIFLTRPVVTLFGFNALFSFYHMPVILDYLMVHPMPHTLYQSAMFVAAYLMWWPIINPMANLGRLSELKKMGLIFANGALLTPACALIIFAGHPLYNVYTDPGAWAQMLSFCLPLNTPVPDSLYASLGLLPPLEDQQLAGVLMKVLQELVYGIVLGFVFFKWAKNAAKSDPDTLDPLKLQEV
jgi:putative membrane protein